MLPTAGAFPFSQSISENSIDVSNDCIAAFVGAPSEILPKTYSNPSDSIFDGRWELGATSYSGSFCDVTIAKPAERDVPFSYAVKMLRPQWRQSQVALAVLRREAEIGQLVSHSHLVPVLDDRTNAKTPYLIQPWLNGKTLRYFLSKERCPNLRETIWMIRQAAEALAELEKYDFCHADVKPENIMISSVGHLTLLDLGFARRFRESVTPIDHFVGGTPRYMPPEVLGKSAIIDSRSDIYSLGCVMGEMLFGEQFFVNESKTKILSELFRRFLTKEKILWNVRLQHFIRQTESLLTSMLATSPENRPQSTPQLVRELVILELFLIE
ncbi:MAG: serine/threonine protein kinase [Planctomycetaceae bacterium]|jgi:serine/threonine-protein kinase|nr:serine/threonine protein kinase [Planctomycetaceae bacterium]